MLISLISFFFKHVVIFILITLVISPFFIFFVENENLKIFTSLLLSFLCFIFTLLIFFNFSPFCVQFQFFNEYFLMHNIFLSLNFIVGVDGISINFLLLTTFIIPICIFLEFRNKQYFFKDGFLMSLLIIEFFLIIAFTTLDLLVFFVAFESVLIPVFMMIGIFGSNTRRVKATYFFFIYSFVFSLFSFLLILYIYYITKTFNILLLLDYKFNSNQQIFAWFLLFLTFSAKIPMFPLHIWLPEAHVEAPTVGSIILASLLLKLGGYGFLRFSLPLFPEGTFYFLPFVKILATLGIIYSSFAAIYQLDFKKIIAYSSIAHMNLSVLGIFSLHISGVQGALFTMISHGIISAALFLIIGILYDRFNTRYILYFNGLSQIMPIFSSFLFYFMVCNISFPGTSAFVGELLTLVGIFYSNVFIFLWILISSFLCLVYSIRTFSLVCFGTLPVNTILKKTQKINLNEAKDDDYCRNKIFNLKEVPIDLTKEEFYALLPLMLTSLYLGLKPNSILLISFLSVHLLLIEYS